MDYPEHTPQFQKIIDAFSNTLGNPVGEDCLYLNVWSKPTANKNKPVVVFFYGGSEYLSRLYLLSKAKAAF